ncbi:MAG: N-methyl-L-tryptophan oxidase, partial [Acidobacteria bacterium]|nr:N-methyl-L-tryptophan oxidase [Acidobacteriota bacterium]
MSSSSYDIAVLGLGAMGSAAALELATAGLQVVGFDRHRPPHRFGSSHGRSRVIRQAYFEDPAYVPLALRAYELWNRLERDSGESLMRITGAVMIGPPASTVVTGTIAAAERHGLDHEVLEASELTRRFPAFRPADPETAAVFEAQGGTVVPETAIRAQLRLAARRGAELRFNQAIESWSAEPGGGVRLQTAEGEVRADRLVLTAGAWAPDLLGGIGPRITVTRQTVVWMAPSAGLALFLPDVFPVWVWEPASGPTFYGLPALEGFRGGVKVGIHTLGESCHPDSVDRELRESDEPAFHTFLSENIPALEGRVLEGEACLYSNTPDANFVLGHHPQHPQVLIAAGFS